MAICPITKDECLFASSCGARGCVKDINTPSPPPAFNDSATLVRIAEALENIEVHLRNMEKTGR
jgi:NADPH-dependent glutamate synthase beta subunit-like oxidoreductase